MKAQREVSDMTNELLRKNAERLKMSTIETAGRASGAWWIWRPCVQTSSP